MRSLITWRQANDTGRTILKIQLAQTVDQSWILRLNSELTEYELT